LPSYMRIRLKMLLLGRPGIMPMATARLTLTDGVAGVGVTGTGTCTGTVIAQGALALAQRGLNCFTTSGQHSYLEPGLDSH
jgi:hypothetical protein